MGWSQSIRSRELQDGGQVWGSDPVTPVTSLTGDPTFTHDPSDPSDPSVSSTVPCWVWGRGAVPAESGQRHQMWCRAGGGGRRGVSWFLAYGAAAGLADAGNLSSQAGQSQHCHGSVVCCARSRQLRSSQRQQAGHASDTGAAGQEQGEVAVPLAPLPGHPDSPDPPAMLLRESPFPSRALAALDYLGEGLLAPSFWAVNHLLDLQPTTAERQWQQQRCCGQCRGCTGRAMAGLVFAAVLLLSLPIAALGLLLWLPAQAARRPFAYQRMASTEPAEPWDLRQRRTFTFISANVCLLPSGLAKFSNLGRTPQRAAYIARHLAPASPDSSDTRAGLVEPRDGGADSYGGTLHTAGSMTVEMPVPDEPVPDEPALDESVPPDPVPPVLSERFPPDADIVCLQEVFDAGADAVLCRRLGGTFPHVVSEVGARGLRGGRLRLLGSGLLLASRYPLLAADYHVFPNGAGEDALAAKGLLMAQVLVGSARGHRVVGYVSCTHLQAPAADTAIREDQLTLALGWLQQFREEQEQHGDVVAFDIFCGDLNFDNGSPGDALNQQHRLFEVYQDPCRQAPGQDKPWAIGTLLNYLKIYEKPVATPERMRRTLSQPGGRRQFLAAPLLPGGHPDPAPGASWPGRRVDYILFRQPGGARPLRTEVAGVSFITQLAARSDHLPVALRLDVAPDTS